MNPNEKNPLSPAESGDASSGISPVDFTNPSSLASSSSLSTSDSLASAQDSLTSAGQAAVAPSNAIGLNQIGADAPSATMDRPDQPLTPAAPVPGSIGSVTSVPLPSSTDPLVAAASANPTPAAAPVTNVTASNMPTMGGATTPIAETPVNAASPAEQPYYNPFMPNPSANSNMPAASANESSSTSVPPSLQSPTEKFSNRVNVKTPAGSVGSKLLTIIAWLLVVLLAAVAVFLFFKWQDAEQRAQEQKIVYIEKQPEIVSASLKCERSMDGQEEGLENLVDRYGFFNAEFEDGILQTASLTTNYNFTDNDAAEGARGHFDEVNQYYIDIAVNTGIEAITTSYDVNENVGTYQLSANAGQIAGDYIGVFGFEQNDAGEANLTLDSVQSSYEAVGYVCTVE